MLILHIQLITRFRYVSFLGVKFMIFTKMLFPVSWSKWIKPVISVLWFTFPMFLILQAMGRTQLLLGLNTILLKMKSYAARTAQLCFIVHVTWDPIPKSIALANMYFACNAAAIIDRKRRSKNIWNGLTTNTKARSWLQKWKQRMARYLLSFQKSI